jgi:sugar phosphate permease
MVLPGRRKVALSIPVLLLLLAVLRVWPRPAPDRMSRIARAVLIAGLAVLGGGLLIGLFAMKRGAVPLTAP